MLKRFVSVVILFIVLSFTAAGYSASLTTLKPVVANGMSMLGFSISGYVLARSLGIATAESITVPTGARYVNFSSTGDFYANFTTTATVPGDTTDGSASVLNPGLRSLEGSIATISVISPAACVITAEFFK